MSKPAAANDIIAHRKTIYPKPLADKVKVEGRARRRLGDHFGLTNFGVNLTELAPGSSSALAHFHTKQDEFIYILEGTPMLMLGDKEYLLHPGDFCGFRAGTEVGHQLVNKSQNPVLYLEIGDRMPGDFPVYPNDDLMFTYGENGAWVMTHKNGKPY